MDDLKIQHILTLTQLLVMGAKYNFISITTASLGKYINKSQQTASQHLTLLEQNGFIERIIRGRTIYTKITNEGYSEIDKLYLLLKNSLGSIISYIELKGVIVSGIGEGAYYMSLRGYTDQFKSKIGYIPFPGTLNIKLYERKYIESITQFSKFNGIIINGFSDDKRTYGWVKCFNAILNKSIKCNLIFLERTHHDKSIIEIISKNNIRKTIKILNGSKITVKITVPS